MPFYRTPLLRGFFLFVALFLTLTLLAESFQFSVLRSTLPPPAIEPRNPEFNAKLNALEMFARQYHQVDCILLGSSHIDYGLDPAIISQTYKDKTGQELHCFNFGLATLTADTAAPLAQMLVRRYHPRLLIIEVSAHSFDERFGGLARPLMKNSWIRAQLGETSLDGWLLEHLALYGDYRAFKLWQNPYSREVMLTNWKKSDANGYSPHLGQLTGEQETSSIFEFQIDPTFWQAFQTILALNSQTQLALIEAPIQPTALASYVKGGKKVYEASFIPPVADEASVHGVPFWRAQVEVAPQVPNALWFDSQHLNSEGAALLSKWLAQKLAAP